MSRIIAVATNPIANIIMSEQGKPVMKEGVVYKNVLPE
jgi:hypothetical protein